MNLTFNSCKTCGQIREVVAVKLGRLKKKMDEKRYLLDYGYPEERMYNAPNKTDLWEWCNTLQEVMGEI